MREFIRRPSARQRRTGRQALARLILLPVVAAAMAATALGFAHPEAYNTSVPGPGTAPTVDITWRR
ncbi:hypothetical protein BAY60_25455 [Prauserella muralis]|uniref:Uncharacterized protein n=1 Tax=Prauserella muralis TaxID=588067 RepID=A0A2V4ALK6_9PSEU|nr:hypothetical protein BAY60_25455 [Prauserella muralis]TWE29891.1 hypothetical protein FHX69_2583 [Prauserella muralis]